jgi:hypothetical protein
VFAFTLPAGWVLVRPFLLVSPRGARRRQFFHLLRKPVEYDVEGLASDLAVPWPSRWIKYGTGEGEADLIAGANGMQLGENPAKLLDGSKPAGYAAVGDEGDGLGLPLALGRVMIAFSGAGNEWLSSEVTTTKASATASVAFRSAVSRPSSGWTTLTGGRLRNSNSVRTQLATVSQKRPSQALPWMAQS